jgi:hypothetical protein
MTPVVTPVVVLMSYSLSSSCEQPRDEPFEKRPETRNPLSGRKRGTRCWKLGTPNLMFPLYRARVDTGRPEDDF